MKSASTACCCLSLGALAPLWQMNSESRGVAGGAADSLDLGVTILASHPRGYRLNPARSEWIRIPPESPLPDHLRHGEWQCVTTPLPDKDRVLATHIVEKALSVYPESFLAGCLDHVYIVGALRSQGLEKLGMYWDRSILVSAADLKTASDAFELCRTVHHEVSSIYFLRYYDRFPEAEWLACNPPDFRYHDQATAPPDEFPNRATEEDAAQGFATGYGRSDIENDFNTVVEHMFLPDEKFLRLLGRHARLREKARLVPRFLDEVDVHLKGCIDPAVAWILTEMRD